MNIYKERNLRNGCAGLFLYVLQSNGFESFFNGRLRRCQNKILFNELYNTSQQYSFIQFLRICLL